MSVDSRVVWLPSLCGSNNIEEAFWNSEVSLNTSVPDLTLCFQRSVLLWIPCGWLWVCCLFYYLPYLFTSRTRHTIWHCTQFNILKIITAFSMLVTTMVGLVLLLYTEEPAPVDYIYYIVRLVTMLLTMLLLRLEFLKGVHTSGISFIYWGLQLLCDIVIFRSWLLRQYMLTTIQYQQFITYCIYFGLVCMIFISHLFSDKQALKWTLKPHYSDQLSERTPLLNREIQCDVKLSTEDQIIDLNDKKTAPELYIPFWKRVTFAWVTTEIYRGYRKTVTFDTVYNIRPWESCAHLVPIFYKLFNKTQKSGPMPLRNEAGVKHKRRSFFLSIFMAGGYIVVPGILLNNISIAMRVSQPFILGELINFVESEDPYIWKGIFLAAALFITGFIGSVFLHAYLYCSWIGGMRCRAIINAVVYRKALRLSGSAKKLTTTGEILNLMSVDAQKIQDAWAFANLVWEVALEIIVCITLMWQVVGPSALASIVVMCIILPLNGFYTTNRIRKLQIEQMKHKDVRMKHMSELLSGIEVIKLYAWEIPFLAKVVSARNRELYYLKIANIIGALSNTIWFLTPYLISLSVFGTFVLLSPSNILDPNTAFVTMSLINVMNFTISILPYGISFLAQAIVSIQRINKFLDLEELDESAVEQDPSMSAAVSIIDGTFRWEDDGRVILNNINLVVPRGQLVAVVGHVGSGKSSLIGSLLGELAKQCGQVKLNGSLAYVPQQAWILNATLRSNVTFGKEHTSKRYNLIMAATALQPDLMILPDGDMTEIGEKGINISGGQKQRVSLARAVYQDEDIYLLDDPLSAVDAHVGKHIFDEVISNKGLLKHKTRILVTHGISFLRHVDIVVVMKDGIISEMGPYTELMEQRGAFAEFLDNFFSEADGYSSLEDEDRIIHRHLSAISGDESGNLNSSTNKIRNLRKRKMVKSESGPEESLKSMSCDQERNNAPSKLIEDEIAEVGNMRNVIIWRYITAGGRTMFYLVVVFQLLFTVSQVLTNLWLSEWSSDTPNINGTMDVGLTNYRLGMYGTIGIGLGVSATVLLTACALGCLAASDTLHTDIISRILRAPMAFFDTTPLGRILNRCSKDMDIIDTNMYQYLRGFFFALGPVVATFFVITYTTPVFLVACIPIVIIYFGVQKMYIAFVRQLKRIDNIRRSPIYAHFDETLHGTSSIRAYKKQEAFTAKCEMLVDNSQKTFYMITLAQRWLGISMETLGATSTFFAATFAVLSRGSISGGLAGLSVSYSLNITMMLNSLIRCMTELETNMVSVERVDEYANVSQEADWDIPETETDENWPTDGKIQMNGYGTRYRPGLDLVLRNVNCEIGSGEKIGIVGRTGAGKSSLALALFRIIESAEGGITIDGVPIANLGLHNLRSRLTIIPQDPVIFSGSLRENLDPLEEYSDHQLWDAVEKAYLLAFVQSLSEGLDYECGEGGASLSVGQRQLVCLARAVLRHTKVLVLDEATAAVDLETDSLIQKTIRDVFRSCTVLTIAHRLATVLDYDRIMVLENGCVKEFASPKELLAQTDSVFYSLAKEAGVI